MRPPLLNGLLSAALIAAFAPLAHTAHAAAPAACATFDKQALPAAPIANLCIAGTASAVKGGGPWSWTCSGSEGAVANCSATVASAEPQAIAEVSPPVVSIKKWVGKCDGVTDQAQEVAKAFAAAKGDALHLLVDCPVYIKVGMDIARPIFVESGVTVLFGPEGKFITDSALIPTFAIINSDKVVFRDWRIQYVGSLPTVPNTGGYWNNGNWVSMDGDYQPARAFYERQKTWMMQNRGLKYLPSAGPFWSGPTNGSALIYIKGSTSNLIVQGMKLFVPDGVKPSRFIPVAFAMEVGEKSNQELPAEKFVPPDPAYYTQPSNLEFTNIDIDGSYMGWVGTAKNARFTDIRSHRYADLQDDTGEVVINVGGLKKWFAPPHLFYLGGGNPATSAMPTEDITIHGVVDEGTREGPARDKLGDVATGNASSLKIGGKNILIDSYTSHRPDGFLDLLTIEGAKISDLKGTCDTSFVNHIFNCINFNFVPLKGAILENIHIVDKALVTKVIPLRAVDSEPGRLNTLNTFTDVSITMNAWQDEAELSAEKLGKLQISAHVYGEKNNTKVDYIFNGEKPVNMPRPPMKFTNGMANGIEWSLAVKPSQIKVKQRADLIFKGSSAINCVLEEDASKKFSGSGIYTLPVVPQTAGTYSYTFRCHHTMDPSTVSKISTTLLVTD